MKNFRKFVSVLALIVLVWSDFLTSFSYAIEEIVENTEVIQTEMWEIGENEGKTLDQSDETLNEELINHSEENYEGEEPDEEKTEEETENMEILEEISQGNEETLQGLSWENIDDENIDNEIISNKIENTEEEKSEIEVARETLNENVIEKSEKYNDVVVNVSAKEWTFPKGTYVDIEAVRWNQLEEVRQQISDENNNILEESEIVAFDIKFLYKLSDETEIELQPKNGESVKVSFDYSDNTELEIADKDETKEIQVYHINDKDESGEYVNRWEEKVEKIEINQKESENIENWVVIDAEKFSVYALVLIESWNPTQYTLTLDPWEWSIVSGENITINEETWTWTILSEDGNVTLPLAVRENHEFLWWYTVWESFTGSGWDSYEITGNITLYAKWQEGEDAMYTVTFDANRWTFANLPNPQTVASWSLIYAPDQQHIPELPWYTFTGWWTEPRGGTQWDFDNDIVTGNITLYAHWMYDLENGDLDVYILDANGDISTYVMMDRNIWASEVYNQDFSQQNTGSFGFIYQWWNNWWFERCRGNGTTCHGVGTSNPDTSTSQVDKSIWSNYYNSKYASKTWIAVNKDTPWQKNPDVKDNLWWWESDEVSDKQWPCPDWYYVPLKAEFNDIILKWNTLKWYNITANRGFSDVEIEDFTHDFLWPLAWAHRKWEITDSEQWGCAEYWTSVTSDTKNAKNIFFCKAGANTWFDGAWNRKYDSTWGATRNNWSTVRCFKNTNTSNLVIDPDWWKGAVISVDKVNGVNTIVALTEPSRTQAGVWALIFSGWYTSPTFESNTKKEARDPVNPQADPTVYTLSANETGLYAKWSCPSGHTYDWVNCASAYNITFDANEGFFDVGGESKDTKTELLDYGAIYNYSGLPTPTRSWHVFKGWYTNFDWVDDYVDYGIGFKFSDKISIHVSAYMEDWTEFADGNSGKRIISCLNWPNTAEWWAIKGKEKTKIQFACVDSSNWKSATSDKLWSSLAPWWHDFDVVFDGQNARLYLDGDSTALATSEDFTWWKLTYNSTNSILLWAQPGTSNAPYSNDPAYFHWKIKDVIIQNSDQRITSTDVLLVPHQDVTYYALWEEIDGYTVTFDSMGWSDVPSQTVKSGTTWVRPSDPTKTWYIFSGWFLDWATEEFYFTWTQITGNITLYAHWNTWVSEFTVNCYKKVLDVDHNVLENDSYSYLTWIVITWATADEITVADYTYKCVTDATEWYEYTGAVVYSSEDENWTKKETATILPDGSMKIDMFFQPVQNQFTLNPATHTSTAWSSQNGLYYYWAKVTLNGDSNDDCFEWDEWNWFPEWFENSKQTYFYMPNRAVSVTPSVTQNTYNIIFSGNGSTSWTMLPMNWLDCSESKPLTINNFEKSWHNFSGWSETENWAKKYENNESVSRLSTIDKDDVFLYAVWDVDQYDVNVSIETWQENMWYLSWNTSTWVSLTWLYEYGKNLVFIAVPEIGYVFDYWMNWDTVLSWTDLWDGTNQLTVVVNQILDIIAFFKPAENTPYTVEHYKQNLDQTWYEFAWSGTMYWTTNGLTNATGTDYEWFSLHNGDISDYQTWIKADWSTVVRLYYDRNRYIITWNTWNGFEYLKTDVSYGQHPHFDLTPPERDVLDPEDEDYDFTFTGWSRSWVSWIVNLETEIITGDTTYTAEYDRSLKYYTVKYYPNGWTWIMPDQTNLQLHTSWNLAKNSFTRTGYIFSGWYSSMDLRYEDEQEINMGRADGFDYSESDLDSYSFTLVLYAQWKPSTDTKVTVNYYLKDLDVDNNVLIDSTTEYATWVEFTWTTDSIIESILSRYGTWINGYEYSTSIVYGPDYPDWVETWTTTVLADGSRVIDMYYVPSIYQFILNSATNSSTQWSSESTWYYYWAKVTLSGNSNDDCFTWSGWTTSWITLSDNTVKQTSFAMPANNVEVTPSTVENTYNIIFNGNESTSWNMSPMNGVRCTESTWLTLNAFGRTWHTFTGWSTTVWWSKEYVDGATVDRLSTWADVNLYAIWDINKFNVSVNVATWDHGSLQWSWSWIYDFGETLVIIAVPELGYLFDYWEINWKTELPEWATTWENQLTIVVNQILDIVAHFTANEKTVIINYYEMNTGWLYPNEPYYTDSLTWLVWQTKSINPESRIWFHLDDNRSNTWVTISENSEDNVINIYYERERYIIERSGRYYQMPDGTYIDFVNIIPDNQPYYQYYYGEEIRIESVHPAYWWIFSGWYDATSEGKWFPSDEVSLDSQNITFHMPDHNVWVEPIMEHIPYTLSFTWYEWAEITNLESCSYWTWDRETYYDYSECLPNLNKEWYWFNWWDDENGNWVRRLNDYSQYPILNKMPAHDYMLVANFEPINTMPYEKYYYFQDIEWTGYTLSWDLTDLGNNGVTDQEMPGREPLYNIDWFQYSWFGYSGIMLPWDQWPYIKATWDNYINYYYDRNVYLVDVNYDNKKMSITWTGEYRYEAPVTLTATVKTWYSFSGFISYQGELLSSGSVYNFTMPDSFVGIIYADANPIEYSIEYEPNWWELDPYSSYANYTVESFDLSIWNPYKDGYTFLWWTWGVKWIWEVGEPTKWLIIPSWSIWNRKYFANFEATWSNVTVNYYLKKIDPENNVLTWGVDEYISKWVVYTWLTDSVVDISALYGTGIEWYEYTTAIVYGSDSMSWIETGTTTILWDGTRSIDIYYTPKKYNFTVIQWQNTTTAWTSISTWYYFGAYVTLSGDSTEACFGWDKWWSSDLPEWKNQQHTTFEMPAHNVTVESMVSEKSYNIVFDANGGTWTMSTLSVQCTSWTLSANNFERNWYTFTGWSRNSDWPVEFTGGSEVHRLSTTSGWDVTLFAVWDVNHYTVTFDLNWWNLTWDMTETKDYTIETPSITLDTYIPERNGYTFTGWYKGDSLVNAIAWWETWNYTLIAKWEAQERPVPVVVYKKMLVAGEYSEYESELMWWWWTVWESYTAPIENFISTWFHYEEENENNRRTVIVDPDLRNEVAIFFDRNQYPLEIRNVGEWISSMTTWWWDYLYEEPVTINVKPFAGWEFLNWTLINWSLDGVDLNQQTLSFNMPAEEIKISPNLNHIEYTVSFDAWLWTSVESQTYYYDDLLSGLNIAITTRSWYSFSGWYLWNLLYTADSKMPAESITLTAKWKAETWIQYQVNHRWENIEWTAYDVLLLNETKYGETDARTLANSGEFEWFTLNGDVEQKKISPSGTTVVDIYYSRNKYLITFKDWDGNVIQTWMVAYGDTPIYSWDTPTKTATAQYSYTFNDLRSPSIENVTTWAIYTAQFDAALNSYSATISSNNTDFWTVSPASVTWLYGSTIEINGNVLTISWQNVVASPKESTAQYTYTFSGWNNTCGDEITGNCTITAEFTRTVNEYLITFVDGDGKIIQTWMLAYGEIPEYTWATPTKTAIAQYTYTFNNTWSPAVEQVTTWVTYTAQFDSTVNEYLITFVDGDGKTIQTWMLAYGEIPEYTWATPTKTATAQYTYTFNNTWSPAVEQVTTWVIYTAQFDSTVNEYLITFVDWDGKTIQSWMVAYGETPVYSGSTPTKTATAQYTYTFNNTWTPIIESVTTWATYTAQFDSTLNTYTIIFVDDDATELYSQVLEFGETPVYSGATPRKTWYTFTGWSPEISTVTWDTTYTAIYSVNQYKITFIKWNGEEDYIISWDYDSSITAPDEPTRNGHTFMWWNREIPPKMPAENLTITAQWEEHEIYGPFKTSSNTPFRIALFTSWVDAWKIDLKTTKFANGWISDEILAQFLLGSDAPTTPEWRTELFNNTAVEIVNIDDLWWDVLFLKFPKDEIYSTKWYCSNEWCSYFASEWSPSVTGEFKQEAMDTSNVQWPTWATSATNYIKYNTVWDSGYVVLVSKDGVNGYVYVPIMKYTIKWNVEWVDVETDIDVKYGTMPNYDWATPEKQADAQYTYTFREWSPEVKSVTWNTTYTAQFDSTVNEYLITFVDGDGKTIQTWMVAYGETPVYSGSTPTKTATAQYTYTFREWSPEVKSVTWNTTYTAQFDSTVNEYLITFVDGDGKTIQTWMVAYGETPVYSGSTPTKTATAQYTYTFNNTWTPTIESVTTWATYTAQFDPTVNEYTVSIVPSDTDMWTVSPSEIDVSYGAAIVESGNTIAIWWVTIEAIPNPADVQYTYEFDSWTNTCGSELVWTCTIQANFKKILNKYNITWKDDNGNVIDTTMVEYGATPTHSKPTKPETEDYRYVFVWWMPELVAVTWDAEYTATFTAEEKEKSSKWGSMSGWGWRKSSIDDSDNTDNQHWSAEENSDLFTWDYYTSSWNIDDETLSLYEWAHENDITTIDTFVEANADGYLTRWHMAKMAVKFAEIVLWKTVPDTYPAECNWNDKESERESQEIKIYAKKACALWVMWINVDEFMPNKILNRAEFGTTVSRLLWWDKYNITDTDHRSYYEDHLYALKKQGIMMQINNPEDRRELRKWVRLVFRRITEKFK